MVQKLWKSYAVVAVTSIAAFLAVPTDGWVRVGWLVGIGYAAAAAMVLGMRLHGREDRSLWIWFTVGIFGNTSGILVEQLDTTVFHGEGFPSPADYAYLSLYPAMAIGLGILIRRRTARRDWGALVDATTVTTGLGLLAWVFMIRPLAADHSIGLLGHIVSMAYPVGDIVLVAMTVRLQLGAGHRTPSYWFITGSLLMFLAGDTSWAVVNALVWDPNEFVTRLFYTMFLTAYSLFGVASLHPSRRDVGERSQPQPPRLSPTLLATLTVASLIAPVVLAIQTIRHQVTDGLAISIGCITLFLLVVTRMAQLIRQVEEWAKKVRELSRTDELTGLPNRRAWTAELPRAIERARRDALPLSIAMVDLDHFKKFNDAFGHPAGDRLLKAAAAAWHGRLRAVDHLARYGGEEFIVLLPQAGSREAFEVMSRLREVTPLGQTFSSGVATWDGSETSDELIARADGALYSAKRGGRDRITMAGDSRQAASLMGPDRA